MRTDADGDFTLRETNNGKSRFLRVRARLVGDDLEVNESKLDDLASFDLLDTNWRTVWESNGQLEGPAVSIGTRVFAAGGAQDLGNETFRRQALIWYVLRTAIDRLEAEDAWFAMNRKIAAIYPAHVDQRHVVCQRPDANDLPAPGQADDDWHPDMVLHEFMHLWNYDHNHGTINWLGAVCSLRGEHPIDLTTHNTQENPNVAFAEGCSEWASNALLHALWGVRQRKPLNRRYVVADARPDHAGDGREVGLRGRQRAATAERAADEPRLVEPPLRHAPSPIRRTGRTTTATASPISAGGRRREARRVAKYRPASTACRSGTCCAPSAPARPTAGTPTCRSATSTTASCASSIARSTSTTSAKTCA